MKATKCVCYTALHKFWLLYSVINTHCEICTVRKLHSMRATCICFKNSMRATKCDRYKVWLLQSATTTQCESYTVWLLNIVTAQSVTAKIVTAGYFECCTVWQICIVTASNSHSYTMRRLHSVTVRHCDSCTLGQLYMWQRNVIF